MLVMTDKKLTKKIKNFICTYFKNNHFDESSKYNDADLVYLCFNAYGYYMNNKYTEDASWEDGMIFSYLNDIISDYRLMYKYLRWAFKLSLFTNNKYCIMFQTICSLHKSYSVCTAQLKSYNNELCYSEDFKLSDFFN